MTRTEYKYAIGQEVEGEDGREDLLGSGRGAESAAGVARFHGARRRAASCGTSSPSSFVIFTVKSK